MSTLCGLQFQAVLSASLFMRRSEPGATTTAKCFPGLKPCPIPRLLAVGASLTVVEFLQPINPETLKPMLIRLSLLLILSAHHIFAQGTINFNNRVTGVVDFKVHYDPLDGTFLGFVSGDGWSAQLWAGDSPETLMPTQPVTSFRTGAAAGYVSPVIVTVPGIPGGSQAFVQMRVWDNQNGLVRSWNEAVNEPTILRGSSAIALIGPLGGTTTAPAYLSNALGSFSVGVDWYLGIARPTMTNGIFRFAVDLAPQHSVIVQTRDDLSSGTWTNFAEVVVPAEGFLELADPESVELPQRFYRLQGWDGVIGFVKLTIPPGLSMIANQLHRGDHSLKRLLPVAPDGTQFYKYTTGAGWTSYTYDDLDQAWLPDGDVTLNPGEGGFLRNNTSSNLVVTVVGRVYPPVNFEIPSGFSVHSLSLPVSDLSSLLPCLSPNTQLFRYTPGTGYTTYHNDAVGGWSPTEPRLDLGEAFFLRTESTTSCGGISATHQP
jgi:hypothetical protein